jgi:acetoin utilization deacetylase AcuC-like enzyme
MLPFKLCYHGGYDLQLGDHVFPSEKYRLIHETLLEEDVAAMDDFLRPQPVEDADVLRVHDGDYVRKLKTGTLSPDERLRLEIPAGPDTVRAFWLSAGGTLLAARQALVDGCGGNLSGGFHHAFADHGEGFCMIHDVAIAIRRLQADGLIRTAMTVDTDVHQGNGTAAIFRQDESVFTLSIHQEQNYPQPKPPSDLDLDLADGVEDLEYLDILEQGLDRALSEFRPDAVFCLAGADPYRDDQLGGLALTMAGLQQRDAMVFGRLRRSHIPVVITLAGGYARHVADTVRIHTNTIVAARDVFLAPC